MVGKWSGTISSPQGGTTQTINEFKPDGTEVFTYSTPYGAAHGTGRYTVKGDMLTVTMTGLTIDGRSMALPPPAKALQSYHFKIDGDTLTFTNPGQSTQMVLKQVRK